MTLSKLQHEHSAPIPTTHTCDHCGKSSASLLRCSKCKSAWYCNRKCQSNAWSGEPGDQNGGHRKLCRLLRKAAASHGDADGTAMEKVPLGSPSKVLQDIPLDSKAREAWRELVDHVKNMDCNQAYQQMCLAQDEVKKLQQITESGESLETLFPKKENWIDLDSDTMEMKDRSGKGTTVLADQLAPCKLIPGNPLPAKLKPSITAPNEKYATESNADACGSWIDQGGICSIEYLPNINTYIITLTCEKNNAIPTEINDLEFSSAPVPSKYNPLYSQNFPYFSATVKQNRPDGDATPILSVLLPGKVNGDSTKNTLISMDKNSISLRVQLEGLNSSMAECNNIDTIDNLLGVDNSSFTQRDSTNPSDLTYLRCRSCQSFVIDSFTIAPKGKENTITHVLPLPSGYWDDISDYLSCYEGQAAIDFDSSSSAVRRTVFEDEAVLVMHRSDLKDGATCVLNISGYGGTVANYDGNPAYRTKASQLWKDKLDEHDFGSKSIVCANCYNTLGFMSEPEPDTYRLYKHLLDCGDYHSSPHSPFEKYTAGSFVAREMIRYAESEGIYTFIIEISDLRNIKGNISTASTPCILLRLLSWDSLMGVVDGSKEKHILHQYADNLRFQKILKVIFEEVAGDDARSAMSDNPMEWKWGGIDVCCLPRLGRANSTLGETTKASSVKMFLSSNEWSNLKASLVGGMDCFSGSTAAALIMMKLGAAAVSSNNHNASLSFLPVNT